MTQPIAKVMVLITVILMDLLAGMEFDLFVPSFPELQSHFSLSPFWIEALLSVNFVGYCLSMFFVGGLADRYGPKPIILLGLIIFTIGSVLCLWGGSYYFLFFGRFFQGVGVAAPAILSFLIIADAYSIKKQQFLTAILNAAMNVSVAAAPVLGSYVSLYFHWQGNFIALLFLGLMVLAMTLFFVPTYELPDHKEPLSLRGYAPLFQSKSLLLLVVYFIFSFVPYWIFVGMSPLLYMHDLGVSLSHFGYYQGVLALVFAFGSLFFGLIINRVDSKKMLSISGKIFIFSLISVAYATFVDSHNPLLLTFAFLPFCIGQIVPTTILYPICLNFMPKAKGRVSATIQGSRLIFTAVSLQIAGHFYQGTFRNIGVIIIIFIVMVLITQFFVVRNREIMNFA